MSIFAPPTVQPNTPTLPRLGAPVHVAGYGHGTFQGAAYTLTPGTLEVDEMIAEIKLPNGKRVFVNVYEVREV